MNNIAKKVLVLHSGGMDSTVCLLLALEAGYEVTSLGIDYHQRHSIELEYAESQCQRYGVLRRVIRVEWDKPKREMPLGRKVAEMSNDVSSAFLPGRNLVFLTLACAEATGIAASEVWIGINSIEYSGYPDCTPDFLSGFQKMIKIAGISDLKVEAPLIAKNKREIASEAKRLGLGINDTWSCYRPITVDGKERPCGECDACVLHNHAWECEK